MEPFGDKTILLNLYVFLFCVTDFCFFRKQAKVFISFFVFVLLVVPVVLLGEELTQIWLVYSCLSALKAKRVFIIRSAWPIHAFFG